MANNIFKFKQFEADQSGCTMKINTDGVLLGAVAGYPAPRRILDIGTGTGVIALMLAQRFVAALVDAVEIDEQAAACAAKNAAQSIFADRVSVYHVGIEAYNDGGTYDLIVSNPPYFVNDLKNTEPRKRMARHTDDKFFKFMLRKVAELLSATGRFWFILPVNQAESLIGEAAAYRLKPSVIVHLHSDAQKKEFRQIVCLDYSQKVGEDTEAVTEHRQLYIYERMGVHTDAYKQLLKEFFLAF
jgi:tRNA1Val (adenine37-N6)-methyltransferase